jgi:hypothetical protein
LGHKSVSRQGDDECGNETDSNRKQSNLENCELKTPELGNHAAHEATAMPARTAFAMKTLRPQLCLVLNVCCLRTKRVVLGNTALFRHCRIPYLRNNRRPTSCHTHYISDAFFVSCDRTTITQNDITNGDVNIKTGFARIKPAEFVILRSRQRAGEAR